TRWRRTACSVIGKMRTFLIGFETSSKIQNSQTKKRFGVMEDLPGLFLQFVYIDSTATLMFLSALAFDHLSSQVLLTWMGESRKLEAVKKFRSLRPIRMAIGGCYYADRGLVLTIFSNILVNVVNLLMI
ncbi:unnamed protein product, partial [Allacma fusca]